MTGARGPRPGGPYVLNRSSPHARGLAMWVPVTDHSTVQMDRVRGVPFFQSGDQADIAAVPSLMGGSQLLQNSGLAPFGYFDGSGVFGFGTAAQAAAVWVPAHSAAFAVGGAFLKIGDASTGVGIGLGDATFDTITGGTTIVALFEGVRWIPTGVSIDRARDNLVAFTLPPAGNGITVYLNGVAILVDTSGGPNAAVGTTSLMGYNGSRSPWAAACDFRIWNRALSDGEHWSLYAERRWDIYGVPDRRMYFDVGSSGIIAAILAATGTGALAGIGAAYVNSLLTSTGTGALAGTGASRADSTFTSTGSGVLASEGAAIVASLLTAIGQGTLSGVGASTFASTLTSTGTGTFVPTYADFIEAAFGITGAGALAGTGNSLVDSVASMTGTGTLLGTGGSLAQAVYTALGTGTCTLVGRSTAGGHYVISAVGTALWRGGGANINIPLCVIISDTTTGRPKFVGLGLLPHMAGDGTVPSFVQTASGTPDLSAIIHSIPLIETITACP